MTPPRIIAHVIRPRSYCSDRSCGGSDCTTCYGLSAEVLFDVRIVGDDERVMLLDDRLLAELDDADDEHVVIAGVTAGDIRCALREALDPSLRTRAPAPATAPDAAPFVDDDLPF